MSARQRQLISEAKLRIRVIGKEITDLKQEMYSLEQFVLRCEYVTEIKKQNLNKGWKEKLKHGQKNKKNMLKAVLGTPST